MRLSIYILLLFCTLTKLSAQPEMIHIGDDAPAYIKLFQKKEVNIIELEKSYKSYYKSHTFEKNRYTQYFKRYMRWARPFLQADGSIALPSARDYMDKEKQLKSLRNNAGRIANWTFAAPLSTYDIDGITKVTWQTNIYSLDVSLSNSNLIFAGGESGGMWKSTDKGLNWTIVSKNIAHGSFNSVKIHPTDNNTIYTNTNNQVFKSIDQGANWVSVYSESGLTVYEISISTSDPNIVLAASSKGLLRSINGGTSWVKVFSAETWTVKPKVGSGTAFYAIRDNGTSSDFIKSTDSGATWVVSNTGLWTPGGGESMTGGIVATCPTNTNKLYAYYCGNGSNLYGYIGVYVSTDDGATWTNTNPTNSVGNSPTAYTIPSHSNLMAHNGTTGFDQGFYDMAIVVNPSNDAELIAGGTSWFKSTNSGATWTALGSYVGGLSWSHPDMQALVARGNDLWIATDGGLNYSSNFGATIETRMDGITGSDMWGFDSGWNEDLLVGGRYHNGNMTYYQAFPAGKVYRMGGAEAATGYVNPGPQRKVYHSDIGGHKIKGGFTEGRTSFSVGAWPNESYAYYANSEMVFHPNYYNTVFIGSENKILKSEDGGTNYTTLYTFPGTVSNEVYDIEICRSNPQVMYCSQWDGTDDAIWKSVNGGQSWALTTALLLPNNNDRVKLAVSAEDGNVLWAAVTYGSNGKKIYKTINGGSTWINLTTSLLNNLTVQNIMAQYGTDGGIYLGTNGGVLYRNNSHSDWQIYSTGLPLSAETNRLKPFYRDGKIRNGCWGFGVWESPLFENSAVQANPMIAAKVHTCKRDTVFYDDYSVLNHAGAQWQWTFPGASYVSNTSARNPKVLYNTVGTYDVTLTVTNASGQSSTKTLNNMITIQNLCDLDTIPGDALNCSGTDKHAISEDFVLPQTDSLTITAWIKPNGIQPDYASIWMNETGDAAGFNFRNGDNNLAYHWPGGQWWWNSGLIPTQNQWNFVALVAKPTGITIYCNELSSTHGIALSPVDINGFRVGNYKGWTSRNVNGLIDEVAIYNRVLTTAEIRELRHLTKKPSSDPSLVAYYQFNEPGTLAFDKVKNKHLSLTSGANKLDSNAPLGGGVSKRISVTSGGLKDFTPADVKIYFPSGGTYPNGEVVVTRINQLPDQVPGASQNPNRYWVISNYGTNTFSILDSILFFNSGNVSNGCQAADYQLYKRASNAEGNTWGTPQDYGDTYTAYPPSRVTFSTNNGINSFSQFLINRVSNKPPMAAELCNGIDDDCDGVIDEDVTLIVDNGNNSGTNSLRAMLDCAQSGDTIYFLSTLDTINITAPLFFTKSVSIIESNVPPIVIKIDLGLPAFTAKGIEIAANKNVFWENLIFYQKNNSAIKPVIKNLGLLELYNTEVKGNVPSRVQNQSGNLKVKGSSKIR